MAWIPAAAAAAGSVFSALSGRREARRQQEQQREFAQHGIRWRVEDAKAAGLHPLAALGAQLPSYQPVSSAFGEQMGSAIGSLGEAYGASQQKAPVEQEPDRDLDIERYNKARADLAELDVIAKQREMSQAQLAGQPGQAVPVVLPTSQSNLNKGRLKPGVKVVPDEVTAGKSGLTAGVHPGFTEVEIPMGRGTRKFSAMGDKLAQATEDDALMRMWLNFQANRHRLVEFFSQDVPWAVRGYGDDVRRSVPGRHGGGRVRGAGRGP